MHSKLFIFFLYSTGTLALGVFNHSKGLCSERVGMFPRFHSRSLSVEIECHGVVSRHDPGGNCSTSSHICRTSISDVENPGEFMSTCFVQAVLDWLPT